MTNNTNNTQANTQEQANNTQANYLEDVSTHYRDARLARAIDIKSTIFGVASRIDVETNKSKKEGVKNANTMLKNANATYAIALTKLITRIVFDNHDDVGTYVFTHYVTPSLVEKILKQITALHASRFGDDTPLKLDYTYSQDKKSILITLNKGV